MDEFINNMVAKTGIDKETATKVIDFIKEHASEIPALFSNNEGIGDLVQKASGLFGGDDK
jgi:hypothetical protein